MTGSLPRRTRRLIDPQRKIFPDHSQFYPPLGEKNAPCGKNPERPRRIGGAIAMQLAWTDNPRLVSPLGHVDAPARRLDLGPKWVLPVAARPHVLQNDLGVGLDERLGHPQAAPFDGECDLSLEVD